MLHKVYFLLFLLFIPGKPLIAQDCRIRYGRNSPQTLRENNVAEIHVYRGAGKDPAHLYVIDESGCPLSHLEYDSFAGSLGSVLRTFSFDRKTHQKIYTRGRVKNGLQTPYERVTEFMTNDGKLLKRISEDFIGMYVVKSENFDTSNYDKVDCIIVTLDTSNNDTLRLIDHKDDLKLKVYAISEKHGGDWAEVEKSITTFDDDGLFIEYWFYKDGKLKTNYTRKSLEEKEKDNRIDDRDYNPLPHSDPPVDTFYTGSENPVYPINDGGKKYRAIVKYTHSDRDKVSSIELYYRSNGLFYKYIFPSYPSVNETYEYVFRK